MQPSLSVCHLRDTRETKPRDGFLCGNWNNRGLDNSTAPLPPTKSGPIQYVVHYGRHPNKKQEVIADRSDA